MFQSVTVPCGWRIIHSRHAFDVLQDDVVAAAFSCCDLGSRVYSTSACITYILVLQHRDLNGSGDVVAREIINATSLRRGAEIRTLALIAAAIAESDLRLIEFSEQVDSRRV